MENLLPHFEYEVGLLSGYLAEFAKRYPRIAARLGIAGGTGDDLHVDRLVQTIALLFARINARLDDDYPEFTEALIEIVYPGYLRTMPSCAIACFEPDALFGQLTEPLTIARGTTLDANAAACRFRTAYEVVLAPLRIDSARYTPTTLAPTAVSLPDDTTGIVSIAFGSEAVSRTFDATIPFAPVRLHLSGDRPLVAALTDALLLRADTAYVEADGNGIWTALSRVPMEAVGFGKNERLLPDLMENNESPFQCMGEYFSFPDMFNFIDVDLGRMRRAARNPNAGVLTLHVAIRGTPAESFAAQMLKQMDAKALKLFCSPVVNLFEREAAPIQVRDADTAYSVIPVPLKTGSPLEIYSIDAVYLGESTQQDEEKTTYRARATTGTTVPPWRAFSHGKSQTASDVYWVTSRDPHGPGDTTPTPSRLSLVALDGRPVRIPSPQINVDTTATNGELPCRLPIGAPDSDLLCEGGALSCPIALLAQPTRPAQFARGRGALWRVLSAMSSHPVNLAESGLATLKDFLRLHAPVSGMVAQRSIDAMTRLDYKPAVRWMSLGNPFPSFVRGIEIALTFDEAALRDVSLSLFASVLDRLFSTYTPTNGYVQLVLLSSQTGHELLRCAPQSGARPLI